MVSSNKDGRTMAITHADVHMRRRRELGGWVGTAVVFFALLSGFLSLVLCLFAASARSKSNGEQVVITAGDESSICMALHREDWLIVFYEEIGSAISVAFGLLAIHLHLWDATENRHLRREPIGLTWVLTDTKSLVYQKQAAFLFFATWICFVVGEGMLLSEAVSGVKQMKNSSFEVCLSTPYWLLVAAGVVELLTIFLATSFYVLIVKMEREREWENGIARELMEVRRELAALEIIYPSTRTLPSSRQTTPAMDEASDQNYYEKGNEITL